MVGDNCLRFEQTEIYKLYKDNIKKPIDEMEAWEKVLKDMHDYEVKKRQKKKEYYQETYKYDLIDDVLFDN